MVMGGRLVVLEALLTALLEVVFDVILRVVLVLVEPLAVLEMVRKELLRAFGVAPTGAPPQWVSSSIIQAALYVMVA